MNFKFRTDSSDLDRAAVMDNLRGRYASGGVAGVENAILLVQPDGDYWVLVSDRQEAESVAGKLQKPSVARKTLFNSEVFPFRKGLRP